MIVLNVRTRAYLWGKCRYSQLVLQDKENSDCQLIFFFVRYFMLLEEFHSPFLFNVLHTKREARE